MSIHKSYATKRLRSPLIWGVTLAVSASLVFAPSAHADRFDSRISELKQKNTQQHQAAQTARAEAMTLTDKIAAMQSEIAALETQMSNTQAKVVKVQADIVKAEAELAQQRALLAANLEEMYTEDNVSTLEMLASSKNFSHFVDQSQYREAVELKLHDTVTQIKELKRQLDGEKQSLEHLLADQKAMQARLDAQRAETGRLLQLKTNEQAAYNQQIAATNAQVAQLQQQQAALNNRGVVQPRQTPRVPLAHNNNRAAPAPKSAPQRSAPVIKSAGSYPWANVPFPNSAPDPWGMYKRQCVSYTAWKVASTGRHMPYWGGRGNAKQWDDNARAAGIPVDGNPRVGDVAVSNAGAYGHVMYVEAVYGDGTIYISQYNAGWDGRYSEARRSAAGLSFIHF